MGRVEDARRRAAEAAADHGEIESAEPVLMLEAADVAELAREPYPVEIAEHRRHRHAPLPLPAAPSTAVARPSASDASENPAVTLPQRSLFERLDAKLARKIVVDHDMAHASREQYRRLAASLHHGQMASGLKVVMIASALSGEGKTLTASNLAMTFSESYKRSVLLIDGDLRKPSIDTLFGIDGSSGLSDGLTNTDEQPLTLHQVSQRLTILPAGQAISDPMAGLTSDRMRRVIEEAREAFDWVIIDTPPVGILTDANLLSSMVDGAVLVVKAEATPHTLVQRAVEALGRNRIVGVVLNRASTPMHGSGYEYASYYAAPNTQAALPEHK